jgi:Helix-turn-helix domain
MAKKYYTVSEAAKHLKIGRAGVHAAIQAGRLHPFGGRSAALRWVR